MDSLVVSPKMLMCYRGNIALATLCICSIALALIHIKEPIRPCNATTPIYYDSGLFVEGEGLQLSCYVCAKCEPNLRECKKTFDVAHWLKSRSFIRQKKPKKPKTLSTVVSGNLRERLRARIDANKTVSSSDILRPQSRTERIKSSLGGQWNKFQLRLYFVVQRPQKSPEKLTDVYGRGRAPRVYVHQDRLVFRQTRPKDTGIYTCYYRGRPRVVWTITVLPPGQEPYRVVRWPMVTVNEKSEEITKTKTNKPGSGAPDSLGKSGDVHETNLRKRREATTGANTNSAKATSTTAKKAITAASKNNSSSNATKIVYIKRHLRTKTLIRANIQIYSVWSAWSPCIPCTSNLPKPEGFNKSEEEKGREGFQIRVGTCYVRIIDPFYPIRPYRLSRGSNEELRKHGKGGLPCRSHVIVEAVSNSGIRGLARRPSELIVRSCIRPCGALNSTKNYKYKGGARGLDAESASKAATSVSRPIKRKYKTRDGERLVLTCPVRGSVHSPISWFFLDTSPEEAQNFTNTAFSDETFGKVGSPAAWIALWRQQLNLSDLFVNSSGRITLDPAYNIVYHEVRTTEDMNSSKYSALPLQHLACIHGDARGENFMRADWAGDIFIESIPRWKYYYLITGMGTVLSTLMPAALSICTVLIVIWGLNIELGPKMEAATYGHAYRDQN